MESNKRLEKTFILIAIFFSFAVFIWLLLTPSISTNYIFLNYSLQRFLALCISALFLLTFFMFLAFYKTKILTSLFGKLITSRVLFFVSLFSTVILFLFLGGIVLKYFGTRSQLFNRILPLILLPFFLSIEIIIFQQYSSKGQMGRSVKDIASILSFTIFKYFDNLFSKFFRIINSPIRIMILLVAANAPIIFINAIRFKYPIGFAGLYSLMAKEIVENHFLLPLNVPFYGPGGIPFAYPPLAMYLMAIFVGPFGLSPIAYLRFAPSLFFLIATLLFFYLVWKYTQSKSIAIISSILLAYSSANYYLEATAGGIVRGLALCFLLAGLITYLNIDIKNSKKYCVLTGIFFALTILCHLSYAFIFAIIIFIATLFHSFTRKRWGWLIIIVLLGIGFTALWWGTVIYRYGLKTFIFAFNTHGNGLITKILTGTLTLGQGLTQSFSTFNVNPFFTCLALIGLIYMLLQKKYFVPLLFLVLLFMSGENGNYLILLGSLAIGVLLSRICWTFLYQQRENRFTIVGVIFVVFCLILICESQVVKINSYKPMVTNELISLSSKLKGSVSQKSSFLFLDDNNSEEAEWLPYFLNMEPKIGTWGGEWIDSTKYTELTYQVRACEAAHSFTCVKDILARESLSPNILIIHTDDSEISDQIKQDNQWKFISGDNVYLVWIHK
jgi:hypothetical protein